MLNSLLSPIDVCGCGDTGYLTAKTIPIALIQGAGKIINVPVYSCNSDLCDEYAIPSIVTARLEELAEEMEDQNLQTLQYSWKLTGEEENKGDLDNALLQAFTLKFHKRNYPDAQVILIIPGQTIVLQSNIDLTEYYTLQHLPEVESSIDFSFSKFYYDAPELTYDDFIELDSTLLKELGILKLDEIEDVLLDEFGEIIDLSS